MENAAKQREKATGIVGLLVIALIAFFVFKITTSGDKKKEEKTPSFFDIVDSANARTEREKAKAIEAEEKRPKTKEEIRLYKAISKCMSKYNCSAYEAKAILNHRVCNGMTKQMCIAAWGKPGKINTTRAGDYTQEQWVYGEFPDCSYLYFERDGILHGSQTSQ